MSKRIMRKANVGHLTYKKALAQASSRTFGHSNSLLETILQWSFTFVPFQETAYSRKRCPITVLPIFSQSKGRPGSSKKQLPHTQTRFSKTRQVHEGGTIVYTGRNGYGEIATCTIAHVMKRAAERTCYYKNKVSQEELV